MAWKAPNLGQVVRDVKSLIRSLTSSFTELEAEVNRATPVGTIAAHGGDVVPEGWLLCNGTSYQRDKFPELAGVLKSLWGGSASTFNVPNLTDVILIGGTTGQVGAAGPVLDTTGGTIATRRVLWIIKV